MASGSGYYGVSDGQHVYVYLSWTSTHISGNTYSLDIGCKVNANTSVVPKGFVSIWAGGKCVYDQNHDYNGTWYAIGVEVTANEDGTYSGVSCGAGNNGIEAWASSGTIKIGPANYSVSYVYNDNSGGSAYYDGYDGTTHTVISTTPSYNGDYDTTTTYTITGNANGATGVSNTSITANKRSYSIHTFKGWSTTNGATTATYTSGSKITVNKSITLYGVWSHSSGTTYSNCSIGDMPSLSWPTEGTYYTVSLYPNASTASVSPTSLEAGIVTTHDFLGWAVSPSASKPDSDDIELWVAGSFYAVWDTETTDNSTVTLPTPTRSNDTTYHTVTLYGNGGTTSTSSIQTSTVVSWKFEGWSTSSSASSGITGSYTPNADTKLYATWSSSTSYPSVTLPTTGLSKGNSTKSYTTTLNLNGGSHTKSSVTTTYTTKYEFNYWSSSSSGSSVGTSISGTTYDKLYAIWKSSGSSHNTSSLGTPTKSISRTITLDADGGSVSSPKYISGSYTFLGWYTTNSSSGTKVTNTSSYYSSSSNDLYAIWANTPTMTAITLPTPTKSVSYTVTFDPSGGTVSPTSKNVTGSYAFNGWSTASGDSSKIVSSSNYKTTSNTTLYAIWGSLSLNGISLPTASRSDFDGYLTVTLNGNGGTIPSSVTNPITVHFNTSYTFAGWSTVSGNSSNIVSNTSSYTCNEATTLYAIWTPDTDTDGISLPTSGISKGNSVVTTYTISLDPIDGSVSSASISTNKIRRYTFKGWSPTGSTSNMVSSSNYIPTSDITLRAAYNETDSVNPVDLPNATKTDHRFLGWSTVEDSTNYVASRYTTSGNITLYANYLARYRGSLYMWHNGKWNKIIVNLFSGDRFNGAV